MQINNSLLIPLGIVVLFIVEITVRLVANPEENVEKITEPDAQETIKSESDRLQSRALGLAGLALAIGSLILGQELAPATNFVVILLGVSASFLVVSYQFHTFATWRRIWYMLQEKTLSYGFLTLVIATVFFFHSQVPSFDPILVGAIVAVSLTYLATAIAEIYVAIQFFKTAPYHSRGDYIKTKIDRE